MDDAIEPKFCRGPTSFQVNVYFNVFTTTQLGQKLVKPAQLDALINEMNGLYGESGPVATP
jgi:hypothetical protein